MIWTVKKGVSTHVLLDEARTKVSVIHEKKEVFTIENTSGVNVLCLSEEHPGVYSIRGIAGEGTAKFLHQITRQASPVIRQALDQVLCQDSKQTAPEEIELLWNNMALSMRYDLLGEEIGIYRNDCQIGRMTGLSGKNVQIVMDEPGTPEFAALLFALAYRFLL